MRRVLVPAALLAAAAVFLLLAARAPHAADVPAGGPGESDVTRFGARGDGSADDTAAVQKAVDSGRGLVRFPRGVYKLTRTVPVDLDKVGFTALAGDGVARVVMTGPGPAFKFVGTHAGTAAPATVRPNVWDRQRTPAVDGLEILGEHREAVGVEAAGTMQLTLTRVSVRGCLHGVHLTGRNRNVLVADCHLYHNRGVGLFLDDVNLHQINVSASHVSYNGGGGIVVRAGQVRNLQVAGCDVEANHAEGGPPTANVFIDSTGGSNAEVAITGCTIQHTRKAAGSANVWVKGPSQKTAGTDETRDGHVTITGNVLSDTRVNVLLQHARGVVVTGNTFWTGLEYDLLAEDCVNVVVGPNNLDRNPRYYREEDDSADAVAFRRCRDCTVSGLHVSGVRRAPAGVVLERCDRFNVTGLTVLDCEGGGLLLQDVTNSRISGCLLRDDRPNAGETFSLKASAGGGNMIVDNLLGRPAVVAAGVGVVERNVVGK